MMTNAMEREEQELDYDRLLENSPDALVVIGQEGDIQYVNALAEQLFGFMARELIGEAVETLVPERHRSKHVFHRAVYSQSPRMREMAPEMDDIAGLRKDGSEFPIEVHLAPLPEGLTVAAIRTRDDEDLRPAPKRKRGVWKEVLIVVVLQLILNVALYYILFRPR